MILRDLDGGPSDGVLFDSDAGLSDQAFAATRIGEHADASRVRGCFTRVSGVPCVIYVDGDRPIFRIGKVSFPVRPGLSSRFQSGLRKHSFELKMDDEVVFRTAYARPYSGLWNRLLDIVDTRDDVLMEGMNIMDTFINCPEFFRDSLGATQVRE